MKYLLDSTVLIDYVRDYAPGLEILDRLFQTAGDLYTCDVVTCESLSRGDADERRAVMGVLDSLDFVALDPDAARWAGDQRRLQIESGARKPSVPDALIAGLAWRLGATIVTRNARDFEPFGVPVLDYEPHLD